MSPQDPNLQDINSQLSPQGIPGVISHLLQRFLPQQNQPTGVFNPMDALPSIPKDKWEMFMTMLPLLGMAAGKLPMKGPMKINLVDLKKQNWWHPLTDALIQHLQDIPNDLQDMEAIGQRLPRKLPNGNTGSYYKPEQIKINTYKWLTRNKE